MLLGLQKSCALRCDYRVAFTTAANIHDSKVALDMLRKTNAFLPIRECYFIADAAYDAKNIYNSVRDEFDGECFIPINPRNAKSPKLLTIGHPVCDAGFAMNRDGKTYDNNRTRQKFCCPFKLSKDDAACPCNHKAYHNGKKRRGCTKYITAPDDYRLSIDRQCTHLSQCTPCVPKVSDTTLVSSQLGKSVFGFAIRTVPKT